MDTTTRRILYWSGNGIVAAFTVGALVSSHLHGIIPAVATIPFIATAVAQGWRNHRIRRDAKGVPDPWN